MSREAYQVPSLGGGQSAFGGGGGGADGFAGSADGPVVAYLCGECNSRVSLKRGDQIRCKECGHRVLYKERTKRFVFSFLSGLSGLTVVLGDPCRVLWLDSLLMVGMNRMVQFEAR